MEKIIAALMGIWWITEAIKEESIYKNTDNEERLQQQVNRIQTLIKNLKLWEHT